ncbi:MAG: acetolactate synthase large subunit [Acidaminococcus sp.]|jgi:acetolactate synthase-1/2/3 large subunit|nr:acetolactate synthase large subunit [Acidaminococcus sp.]MCI2115358.1 acetolactate synthase large subunit [Acidaminococcus sp.]MCI2117416.1 acetolactate synthase large subunit [Acidaminococcus sp.]
MQTSGQLLVKCLENEGVKYVFGIPGEENLEFVEALAKSDKIKLVVVRHEQGAAFMAEIYGRLTGHAGVCMATLGPGATNLVTGVADAHLDGAPVVAITGQVNSSLMHLTSHQYIDLEKIFESITWKTKMVIQPDTINEICRLSFKYAEGAVGRRGATHIDLPVDVAKMEVSDSEKPLKREEFRKEDPREEDVVKAANLINQAKRPLILIGNDANYYRNKSIVSEFVNTLKIPAVSTMMAKGVVPCDSPYSMMTIGIPDRDYVNLLFDEADIVIAIGYDITEVNPKKWNPKRNHKIVHINKWTADVNKYYQCDVQVRGNSWNTLQEILKYTQPKEEPEWAFKIKQEYMNSIESACRDDAFPMKPQRILTDIRKALDGRNDILISDVGAHKIWIGRQYECYEPNTCLISNGFASMGIGVPGAVAAKLVYPERRVLTVTGDGGFMMNSQELETAVRLKQNFVVIIFEDCHYGLIRWKEDAQYGEEAGVSFSNPDFVKLAEAMHCKGVRINNAGELIPAIQKGFTENVPVIIDVPVDYSENMRLTESLKNLPK